MKVDAAAATLEAYEHWAHSYPPVAHNPLMREEQRAMLRFWPCVDGRRVLDLAAGTGRYSRLLAQSSAAEVVAVDFCKPMLRRVLDAHRVCADMMQLPFANAAFGAVISGLALGHAQDVRVLMAEMARVLVAGGMLLYSDIHPEAARMNLTRSFSDRYKRNWIVPHRYFSVAEQMAAATSAGFTVEISHEIRVGEELNEAFPKSDEFYGRWRGLPILLIVRARK